MTASAPLLMVGASLLFSLMGVAVKIAAAHYSSTEIVFYRALVGMALIAVISRVRGQTLATAVPAMHFWRSLSGVSALMLWFYGLSGLPLATAVTLNYTSSVWMALFLMGGAALMGTSRVDGRLVATVLVGFAGVAMVLRPTLDQQQLWFGLAGLLSGTLSAMAYLQISALGRVGEPETRIVFYFSLGGAIAGASFTTIFDNWHRHTHWQGVAALVATGVLATVAQMMMTRAYGIGRVLVNASLQYLGIVFSFVFGVLLFDDPVTAMAIGGMVLIAAAGLSATVLRARGTPVEARTSELPNDT